MHLRVACAGDVSVSLSDAKGRDVAIETVDNGNNTFKVSFVPQVVGEIVARVYFADVEIPASPCQIEIQPHANTNAILVDGLQTSKFVFLVLCWRHAVINLLDTNE